MVKCKKLKAVPSNRLIVKNSASFDLRPISPCLPQNLRWDNWVYTFTQEYIRKTTIFRIRQRGIQILIS